VADITRSTIWVDFNGRTRQTILRGQFPLDGVELALISVSNADKQRSWEGLTVVNGSPAPTAATYQNVADYAQLVYQDAGGELVYVTLPSPQESIFLADQETVDPAAIAAPSAAIIGTVITSAGGVVTAYVGGYRRRSGKEYQ